MNRAVIVLVLAAIGCEPFSPTYVEPSCSTRAECPGGFFCEEGACIGTCAGGLPPNDDGVCTPKIFCEGERPHASIAEALADLECSTISLRAGTYRERLEISRSVTLEGTTADEVILHGQASGTVVTVGEGVAVTLQGLSITRGLAEVGGGILNRGTLALKGVTVSGNRAIGKYPSGGGIANQGGWITLIGSKVTGNQVSLDDSASTGSRGLRGGGIVSTGGKLDLLESSEVSGNKLSLAPSAVATSEDIELVAEGGGVNAVNTVVQLRSSDVRENVVEVDGVGRRVVAAGGGISLAGEGSFVASIATISGNKVYATNQTDQDTHAMAGGVYATGMIVDLFASQISDNIVRARGNNFPSAFGGGMTSSQGSLSAVDVQFNGNLVKSESRTEQPAGYARGGGLWSSYARTNLTRVEVSDNHVTSGDEAAGAGIQLYPNAPSRIESSAIRSNVAISTHSEAYGGGVYASTSGSAAPALTIVQTIIDANIARGATLAIGGGLHAQLTDDQPLIIDLINSTVSGNLADTTGGIAQGGGVTGRLGEWGGRIVINVASSTISNNSASGPQQSCGGLCLYDQSQSRTSQLTVRNSIVAGNRASAAPDCQSTASVVSGGYNLFGTPAPCAFGGTTTGHLTGNAGLLDLAENGGPTKTHALATGSRAIDAGAPTGCTSASGAAISIDQRGKKRENRCDIGAFER